MKSKKVVLCACSMGVSHLVPMVELAKQFIDRGISVTIPVINVGPAVDLVSEFCNSNIIPNIAFHILPQASHLPHFPNEAFDPEKEQYKLLMNVFDRLSEGKGILVNSFDSLEPRAVMALKDGLCFLNRSTPTIYRICPLIASRENKEEQQHPCLSWLDAQPKESVAFLCFGSMGDFPIEQLKEIAIGLENSRQRFLWVVRSPPNPDPAITSEPTAEPDLDILMPEGFLDRTRDRGLIVKQWAPQVDVLKHEAVGCFVSHCGWNSILEAVSFSVPMICWPLCAEQKINKVFLVEEMKIGIELRGCDEGFVQADELEAKVKWIIGSEAGTELRNRMMKMKESTIKAMKEGGSSFNTFAEFLECLN